MQRRNLVRRIIGWVMHCWIDRRAEKRKVQDAQLIEETLSAMKSGGNAEYRWQRFPKRLQGVFKKKFFEQLHERAAHYLYASDVCHMIKNARRCNILVSADEERALYALAFEKSHGLENKLSFAKLLHGSRLPLEVVAGCVKYVPYRENCRGPRIDTLLKEIDCNDGHQVTVLATKIAQLGRYGQLKDMYTFLDRAVPRSFLEIFRDAWRKVGMYHDDLIDLCIDLEDWDFARELIDRWHEEDDEKEYAALLALQLYLSQREQQEVRAIS